MKYQEKIKLAEEGVEWLSDGNDWSDFVYKMKDITNLTLTKSNLGLRSFYLEDIIQKLERIC
ncbi:MAG: hypothetical protein ACI8YQ_004541 [Polaribacter sp.]|jgi:hypothetical protein